MQYIPIWLNLFLLSRQTQTDGDILFAVSLGTREFDSNLNHEDLENYEFKLMQNSISLMGQAIYNGVQVANNVKKNQTSEPEDN